jgi:hypothetical protein
MFQDENMQNIFYFNTKHMHCKTAIKWPAGAVIRETFGLKEDEVHQQ